MSLNKEAHRIQLLATSKKSDVPYLDMDEALWPLALHIMSVENIVMHLSFKHSEPDQRRNKKNSEKLNSSHLNDPALISPSVYGYVRASSRNTPLWKWVKERFQPRFPHLDVLVSGNGDTWLNSDDFLSDAEIPTRSLQGEKIIVTVNADRQLSGLHSLGAAIRKKWESGLATTSNIDSRYFFGLFETHSLEVKIQRLRMYSWTASRLHQSFETMAERHDLDVAFSNGWASEEGNGSFRPRDAFDLEQMIETFRR